MAATSYHKTSLLLAIRAEADSSASRLVDSLRQAVIALQSSDLRKGRVITSTSAGGKSVTFTVPIDLSPMDAIDAAVTLWRIARSIDDGIKTNQEMEDLMLLDPSLCPVREIGLDQTMLRQ